MKIGHSALSGAARDPVPTLTACVILALTVAPAQAQLGIGAGLNYNRLEDIDAGDTNATYESSTGLHFGAFLNLGTETFSIRPGVFYHQLGRYELPDQEELELSAVEVPLDMKLTIAPSGMIDAYLLGGPVITFPRCKEFDQAVEDWQLTADVGVGLDIDVPGLGIGLMPELRYSFGVTDYLSEQFTIGQYTVTPDDGERRISRLMLRLNVAL